MSQNILIVLQAMLVTGQIINAGLSSVTNNKALVLVFGGVVGGLQIAVQLIGNKSTPKKD